jgi:hypothetical protein
MDKFKKDILRLIRQNSITRADRLSREYLRAKPEEKEAIVAGIQFEKWMAEVCDLCLEERPQC